MKKILIIIIVLFTIFTLSIRTKAIEQYMLPETYIEVGVGNNTYLKQENLEIVSGVVDWKKEGKYIIKYRDFMQNIYEKHFIIIPKSKQEYYISKGQENNIKVQLYNEVVDIFYINENSFYLISNYQEPNAQIQDQEKINVTFYENFEYRWEYRYHKNSSYISGQVYNENLIITGLVYNEKDYINSVVIFEITKDRALIKSREIESDKSVLCYGAYIDNDYIFLITSTSGTEKDFEGIKNNNKNKVVILKLSYKNFKIIFGKVVEELDNFIVKDVSFYERRITFNASLITNIDHYTNCIYEYNDMLELVNKYYFSLLTIDYRGYQVTGSELCFYGINSSKDNDCIYIQYLQNNVDNKWLLLDLRNQYFINKVQVINVKDNEIYFSINYQKGDENINLGFCKVDSINGVKYLNHTPEFIDLMYTKVQNNKIINTYFKNENLLSREISLLEIEVKEYNFNYYSGIRKNIIVNCRDIRRKKYDINSDFNICGTYKDVYQYIDYTDREYYLEDIIEIFLNVNIESNKCYQINKQLLFNGLGVLNGNIISSGYIIKDIGKYQLVIKGNNIEENINFTISDLTVNEIIRPNIDSEILSIDYYEKNYSDTSFNNITYNFIEKNTNDFVMPLSIIILTLGIMTFIFVRKKI